MTSRSDRRRGRRVKTGRNGCQVSSVRVKVVQICRGVVAMTTKGDFGAVIRAVAVVVVRVDR